MDQGKKRFYRKNVYPPSGANIVLEVVTEGNGGAGAKTCVVLELNRSYGSFTAWSEGDNLDVLEINTMGGLERIELAKAFEMAARVLRSAEAGGHLDPAGEEFDDNDVAPKP
jgi:hypothetical protein